MVQSGVIDQPKLTDNESESDPSDIAKDEMIKETDDISYTRNSNTSYMGDDANNSETDEVKINTEVGKDVLYGTLKLLHAVEMFNKISFAKRKMFMQMYPLTLLTLYSILF